MNMERMCRTFLYATAAASCLLPLAAHAQQPPGRALAANCFQCHGTDGHAAKGMPSIAGEGSYGDLLEFKRSNNLNNIMVRQAKGYTDEQLRLIADYFASIPQTGGTTSGGD
jgi:sulfide dehydrogenase cytochrome subunit